MTDDYKHSKWCDINMLDGLKGTTNLHWGHQRRLKECIPNLSLRGEAVVSRARNGRVFQSSKDGRDENIVSVQGKLVWNS